MAKAAPKAAAGVAPSGEKVTVKALVPVEHDFTRYGPDEEAGDTFDIESASLQQLLDVNAVEVVGAAAKAE